MKKDLIFVPIMALVSLALSLLDQTGMIAHIAISVAGVAALIAYTVMTKKTWKLPALEILMRVCYGVALLSGIALMKIHGIAAIAIVHKAGATLFAVLLLVLFVQKLIAKKA